MEKLPTYKFCSKEFYRHIRDGNINECNIIYNKYCNGYCKKICNTHPTNNSLQDRIIIPFVFDDKIHTRRNLYKIIWFKEYVYILKSITCSARYNRVFKTIIKWAGGGSSTFIVTSSHNPIYMVNYLPPNWLIIIAKRVSDFDYALDLVPYLDGKFISISAIISILQRRGNKKYIYEDNIIRAEYIINNLHRTIKTFTTKNMCKLISYYI